MEKLDMEMQFTGERFVPSEGGQIRYEHLHRYALCAKFARGKTVLDIASGEGYGSAMLAKIAHFVFGVDVDPESVAFAQEKYHRFSNLGFKVGSCDSIPLPDQSIDVITSFETIEHHERHEEMMQEIKRVLKPGGMLIISSPDKLTYSDIPNYSNDFHIKELYRSELTNLLGNYFNHVSLYGQRLAIGSFVYALDQSNQNTFQAYTSDDLEDVSQRVSSLDSAIYFIAVCSDESTDSSEYAIDSVYIDRIDDLYNALSSSLSFYFHQARQAQSELQHLEHQLQQKQYISSDTQPHIQNVIIAEHSKNVGEYEAIQDIQLNLHSNPTAISNFPPISSLDLDQERPFWSIMIPVYNPDSVLFEQTLRSVLAQAASSEVMQIEVVDDYSAQLDVESLVQKIGQGRISYHRQPTNLGLIANWNDCLQRAKGNWIHLLHQDDIVLPGFYTRLHSALQQRLDIGAAFCRHFHIDVAGNRQYLSPIERQTSGILDNWLEQLATAQRIQFASIVVKRSTYETLGGFYPKAGSAADWEMWKRIAAYYPIWYEPEPLACYRLHALSESSRLQKTGQNIADTRRAIQISASYLPQDQSTKLTNQAMENYALSALSVAEQMIGINDTEVALSQIKEGLKCSQSLKVQTRLVSVLLQEQTAANSAVTLQTEFVTYLEQYKNNLLNETAKTYLFKTREQCIQFILNSSNEQLANSQPDWAQTYQALVASGIQDELCSEIDQKFVENFLIPSDVKQNHDSTVQNLLAAILYYRPEQLAWSFDLERIPYWFINDYLKFMMTPPALFQQIGDADRYYQFMQRWVDYLHDQITTHPDSPFWQKAAIHFTSVANFIPLYFNNEDLKEIYIKRSQIMAVALTQRGYQLDYEFPERSPDCKKIRLGILAAHFSPQSETFASLPSYKHLDRDQFEIVLFSLTETRHRLERYCIGHADAFVVLPEDLAAQVQTVRQADLDMLLVVTNVTAVSNAIALLSMHRLARIQIINVCSCTSTGMAHADYYISGTLTESELDQQRHTETLLLVEGPAHCYDLATEEFARPTTAISRSDLGIAEDEIVYISGSNFFKILPEVEAAWVQILANVPNSRLILYPFNPNWAAAYPKVAFKRRLQTTLKNSGIAIDRVIVLEPAPSYGDVRQRLKLGDVYLDAFPFAGATSLIDPLTLGLPTVVMDGKVFRSRMGAAFLRELQMPELIATTPEHYISQAVALGTDAALRQQVREQILQRMQDCPRFINSRMHSVQTGALLQKLFHQHQTTQLQQTYRLRSINLLTLPDWSQPEDRLLPILADLFREILTHPDRSQITLLLGIDGMNQDEADELVGNVVMHLLTEEELDVGDQEPEISLVGHLNSAQWQPLLPHLSARISLDYENAEAIEELERAIVVAGIAPLPLMS